MLPSARRGFSKIIAGPPFFTNLSAIHPASSWQLIGSETLFSSPEASRASRYLPSLTQAMDCLEQFLVVYVRLTIIDSRSDGFLM